MLRYKNGSVSMVVVLDKRRVYAEGKYPIRIRVCYMRISKYYTLGKTLSEDEWAKLPTSRLRQMVEIREDIEASFNLIKQYVRELANEGDFSFSALNLRLRGASITTINKAFEARIEEFRRDKRYGSMQMAQCALRTFERFAGDSIPFAAVTPQWLRKYELHERGRGLRQTTISMHLRQLRTVINEAKKLGIIKPSADPFAAGQYAIQNGEGRKLALTLSQIKMFAHFSGNKTLEHYRDLWMFIYQCNGINVADLIRLRYSDIRDGEICFVRQKTRNTTKTVKEIRAVVTPMMQQIIDRWGNPYDADAYIFPILKGGETELEKDYRCQTFITLMNTYTKQLGQMLGIGNITTYTARHSFATVLKRSGANIAYISESLGHSNLKITENYLASFEREERERNAALLTNFD